MGKVNSLVLTSTGHKKTGKVYIKSASFELTFKGNKVNIDLDVDKVMLTINDSPFSAPFERSVPLLQVLYRIQSECMKL